MPLAGGYDAANNVTSFSTDGGTATYGNDVTNQLTSATYSGTNQPANEAYSFDKNGNRTMAGYSTGSNNLLTSDGTFNYPHDADGNQTVRTRISNAYATDYQTTFAWDYRNRHTDVEYFDNNGVLTKHVHYVYGVFDHLLATEVDTTGSGSYDKTEHYVLDVSPEIPSAGVPGTALAQPLLQFNATGTPTIRYLEALNRIFAEGDISSLTQGDVADFMLTDNLGTVRYVVDQSGTVLDKIDYNSFGQVSYESNAVLHHFAGYTGGHLDVETGFVDDYHRWYDPRVGRWLNQDPIGFADDVNRSRYVANNATNAVDSTGLMTLYGQNWVMPWNPNAAGFSQTGAAYTTAAAIAVAGTTAGATTGMATGAATGGAVGAVVGAAAGSVVGAGPGATAGAAAGAVSGGLWGGVSGLIGAASTNTPAQAATSGAASGAISGIPAGGMAAVTRVLVGAGLMPLYHYTTSSAAAGINASKVINAPVFATPIPPAVMLTPFVNLLPKALIGWAGPWQIAQWAYKPLVVYYGVQGRGFSPTLFWWVFLSKTPTPI
jgi:RHS repeat-associated protein